VQAPAAEHLGAIRIEGNQAIASDALEPGLALHEAIGDGAAVDPYLLTVDTERIRAAYVRRGFFAVRVTASVEHRGANQIAVFTVVEGPRAVTRIEIAGLPPELSEAAARAVIELRDGAPFDYDAYDAAKPRLAELVERAGYARVDIRGSVSGDPPGVAKVRYEIVPGVRCTFGEIRPHGDVRRELVDAALARLQFATGERYSPSAIAESRAEIYEIGRFSAVQIVPDLRGGGSVIPITIELVEASCCEFHVGFGLGYEPITYDTRARVGGSFVPEGAPLLRLAAEVQGALTTSHSFDDVQRRVRILGSLQRIELWRPRLRGEVEGGYDYQVVEAYTWKGPHLRLGLGSPIGPRWLQVRVGWLIEQLTFDLASEISAISSDAGHKLGLIDAQRIGAYQASLVADLRDNPIEPHRGGYLAVTAAVGTPLAGGQLTYLQVSPELRGYFAVGGTVIAARARVGQIFGDVPVTERYYSGGSSQRGFSDRYLAPHVILDASGCVDRPTPGAPSLPVIGGAGLIETGVELRRQFVSLGSFSFGANLFLDGADVTCVASDVALQRLQWATGPGVWAKLYGFKVRLEVGYRLNRTGVGELSAGPAAFRGDFAWHLGVGETY
jgi:outer membrane protein assembly factor BamA